MCKFPARRIVDDQRFGTDITGHFRHDDRPADDGRADIRNIRRHLHLLLLFLQFLRDGPQEGLRDALVFPAPENASTLNYRRMEPVLLLRLLAAALEGAL